MTLKPNGKASLQAALERAAADLPGCTLAVASADEILFSSCAGPYDILNPERMVAEDDIMWFASTTKLLTSICE